MNPKDKVALITGGARIGRTVACALARAGADLALTYNQSEQSARETKSEVEACGRKAITIQADLTEPGNAERVTQEVKKSFGKLHILVNMASIFEEVAFEKLTAEDWERNLNANLRAACDVSLQAVPLLKKSGGGRIINFTDWTVESGRPRYQGYLPYYVAKAGLKGFTEALALELAPDILVNSIGPGPILAPSDMSKEEAQQVVTSTPLRRWGGADEIAKAVLYLVQSDFVTGEALRVDGGRHLY
jgi:NAD(P)-dependent dehydrogenase (short-subunit alcohol dehydrogenase family)